MAEYIPPLSEPVSALYVLHTSGATMYESIRFYAEQMTGVYADELKKVIVLVDKVGCDPYSAVFEVASQTKYVALGEFLLEYVSTVKTSASPLPYLKAKLASLRAEDKAAEEKRASSLAVFAEVFIAVFVAGILFAVTVFMVLGMVNNTSPLPLYAIVYGVLPLGTVGFLLAIDQFYPSASSAYLGSSVSSGSLGLPGSSSSSALGKSTLRVLSRYARRRKVREFMRSPLAMFRKKPQLTFVFSVPAGVVLCAGLLFVAHVSLRIAVGLSFLVVFLPYGVFSYVRLRRISAVEAGFPAVCRILSSTVERGLPVSLGLSEAAFRLSGVIGSELAAAVRDIRFGGGVYASLDRLAVRLGIGSARSMVSLVSRASHYSSDMAVPFRLCAEEAEVCVERKVQRRSSMNLYVVVMYLSYAVFIFVQFILSGVFMDTLIASGAVVSVSAFYGALMDAVLIHGVCCGFAAGMFSGGGLSEGVFHACVLLAVGIAASAVMTVI